MIFTTVTVSLLIAIFCLLTAIALTNTVILIKLKSRTNKENNSDSVRWLSPVKARSRMTPARVSEADELEKDEH